MKSFAIFGSSSQQFFFSMRGSFQLADILVRKLSGRGCEVDHHLEKCQQKEFIMRSQKSTSSTSRVIVGRGAWARKYTTFGGNKIGDWGLGTGTDTKILWATITTTTHKDRGLSQSIASLVSQSQQQFCVIKK